MLLPIALLSLLHLATSSAPPPQHVFSNPSTPSEQYHIPTVHESAILARRILNLSSIATLSTVFPSQKEKAHSPLSTQHMLQEDTPQALWAHQTAYPAPPIGLMDYYASCFPQPSNPTILAISIATTFRNTQAGSNVTLSLRYHPPQPLRPATTSTLIRPPTCRGLV